MGGGQLRAQRRGVNNWSQPHPNNITQSGLRCTQGTLGLRKSPGALTHRDEHCGAKKKSGPNCPRVSLHSAAMSGAFGERGCLLKGRGVPLLLQLTGPSWRPKGGGACSRGVLILLLAAKEKMGGQKKNSAGVRGFRPSPTEAGADRSVRPWAQREAPRMMGEYFAACWASVCGDKGGLGMGEGVS